MGTAERRLQIMKQLCRRRHATMSELADEFSVSVRTIQRDIFELTFLMPLYVKPGRHEGGIYVCENYTMDRMYMSAKESELLIKVKSIAEDRLSADERGMLEQIIKTYSKPKYN